MLAGRIPSRRLVFLLQLRRTASPATAGALLRGSTLQLAAHCAAIRAACTRASGPVGRESSHGWKMWDDTADMPFEQRFAARRTMPVGPSHRRWSSSRRRRPWWY